MKDRIYPPIAGALGTNTPPVEKDTLFQAYAQASVMLIECLMITLLERGVLTKLQLIDAVEDVIAAKLQMVQDEEDSQIAVAATGILRTMANSLAAAGETLRPRRSG